MRRHLILTLITVFGLLSCSYEANELVEVNKLKSDVNYIQILRSDSITPEKSSYNAIIVLPKKIQHADAVNLIKQYFGKSSKEFYQKNTSSKKLPVEVTVVYNKYHGEEVPGTYIGWIHADLHSIKEHNYYSFAFVEDLDNPLSNQDMEIMMYGQNFLKNRMGQEPKISIINAKKEAEVATLKHFKITESDYIKIKNKSYDFHSGAKKEKVPFKI